MGRNPAFDFGDAGKRLVPASLEFAGDQAVGWIGGVILPEGAVGGVAGRFEITVESLTRLVAAQCRLLCRSHRRGDCAGPDDTEQRILDRIIDA